jgi:competence protein ComEC
VNFREHILYVVVLGFAGGIVFCSFLEPSIRVFGLFVVANIVLFGVFISVRRFFRKKARGFLVYLLVFTFAFTAGYFRNVLTIYLHERPVALENYVNKKVTLVGVLVEDQERRDYNTRLTVRVREVEGEKIAQLAWWKFGFGLPQPKILATTNNPKTFQYGDVVKIRGLLVRPENFYTDTGREFDYVGYLESNDIAFLAKNVSVEVLGREPPSRILSGLFFAKRKFVQSLGNMLPEPHSSLAAGILIDGKQSINGELQEKFQRTGLIHIVVLSGSNVSIVANAIGQAFSFLPRTLGLMSASVGIVVFAMITGASSTIVRASIMAILVLLSKFSIKKYDPARGLFIASFLMLAHNPTILEHSPSFQLSFLATFAVVKVIPMFEYWHWSGRVINFLPERFGLRELVTSNILVQAFLFPILTWMTGFFSAVSLPVNLLVLPFVPLTMLLSFLTGLVGLVLRTLGLPFALGAELLLTYELAVVDFFARSSWSQISFSPLSGWFVASLYICLVIFFCFMKKLE